MKTVVIGPGAIGCLFAGLLAEAGHDVCLLDKDPLRARLIAADGVHIENGGARLVRVAACASAMDIGPAGLVLVCVKAYDTAAAVAAAVPLFTPDTIVVSMQNGFGNVEQIAGIVHGSPILCGITAKGSTSLGPGQVRHAGNGPTWVAPARREHLAIARDTAATLTRALVPTTAVEDMTGVVWSKMVVNAAINPVTAVANVPNGALLEDPELRTMMRHAAVEAAAVARAKGIRLMYDDAAEEAEKVCRVTRDNISSMLQDIRRGQRTEIGFITGVIVNEARALGIAVPINEMLLARVTEKETRKS